MPFDIKYNLTWNPNTSEALGICYKCYLRAGWVTDVFMECVWNTVSWLKSQLWCNRPRKHALLTHILTQYPTVLQERGCWHGCVWEKVKKKIFK